MIFTLKRLHKTTWNTGILLVMFATIIETASFVYMDKQEHYHENLIRNIEVTLFVHNLSYLNKVANLAKQLGGKQTIIKPKEALALLPKEMQKTVGEDYLDSVPYIIVIHNSQATFTIKDIIKLKKLLTSYDTTMNFDKNGIKDALSKENSFRLISLIVIIVAIISNALFGYIIRKLFMRESENFSIFLWNLGLEKRFINLISFLFFGLIAVVATLAGWLITAFLLFILSALNGIDIALFVSVLVGIFAVNIIIASIASFGALK